MGSPLLALLTNWRKLRAPLVALSDFIEWRYIYGDPMTRYVVVIVKR